MASSSNPTLTATQPEVSSELQRRGESIAMDSDIEDLETWSTTPNETIETIASVGNEEGDVNPFARKKRAKTSVVWNDCLLFSKFLFWWKQRHWICCLVTHSLILF
ncbi:hypothetical protein Patl1_35008 [Pistacia atlantica]|uniref:Uncharacterized protein n=1 Tax=Pistacia atlantica TaxID=434234 RepID=A0ACC0ZVE1_9ROSI|nr:hypothetical protein Patl1_35008 [Pistacia atlantica]